MTKLPLLLPKGYVVSGEGTTYKILDAIRPGASGVVYRGVRESDQLTVALKFFLPRRLANLERLFRSGGAKRIQRLAFWHERELQFLTTLDHPSIVPLLDHGSISPSKDQLLDEFKHIAEVQFIVTKYIRGDVLSDLISRPLDATWLDTAQLTRVLEGICDILIYLHNQKEYLHGDIRPENIIIEHTSHRPILIDFALCKNFNFQEVAANEDTIITADPTLLPQSAPIHEERLTSGKRSALKKIWFPGLDLMEMGHLLRVIADSQARFLAMEDTEYLRLLASELSDWNTREKYTAQWLKDQVTKLDPTYSRYMGVEELRPPSGATKYLQIPNRQVIISDLISKLINTRSFRRLRSINQLSLVDLIYPGAGYRRSQHSLRAYGYCADFLVGLNNSPAFKFLFTPRLARQALVVALLHDINHFPFLHTFQELRWSSLRRLGLVDLFCNGELTGDKPSIYEIVKQETDLSPEDFRSLLMKDHDALIRSGFSPGLQIVKSLIDSGADIDKLAYLEDDSSSTGVAYGRGIDVARLVASATIAKLDVAGSEGWHLAYREEGVSAVESLVMARYWMFRNVYWHRTNRAVMTMILETVREFFPDQDVDSEQQSLFPENEPEPKKSAAREFIMKTMWCPEETVLTNLNLEYKERFGRDSTIANIIKHPPSIYQRLFSIQGTDASDQESQIYARLVDLDVRQELLPFRQRLTEALNERYVSRKKSLSVADVLVDIPRRELGTSGRVIIVRESGKYEDLAIREGPVKHVLSRFDQLAKRVRIFVRPGVLEIPRLAVQPKFRAEMLEDIERSLPPKLFDEIR